MATGILHPLIHLGYGLEWNQPAITAEALAQTATHDNWTAALFQAIEPLLAQHSQSTRTLVSLMHEAASDPEITGSPRYNDDLRVRDGVLGRAGHKMAPLVAQWAVSESTLSAKIAELANFTCAMVFGAQRAHEPMRIDFTLMHCANAVPLAVALATHPDIPPPARVELVRRLGQYALMTYVAQGSPRIDLALLRDHRFQNKEDTWPGVVQRVFAAPDDGHAVKLVRALRFGQTWCEKNGSGAEGQLLQGDDWVKAARLVVEIVERRDGRAYVRGAGFEEAWKE